MANVPISGFTVPANTIGIGATGYSLTGSASASFVDLAGTWNTTGTPTLIKANVTDTASNAASLLMDLQVGGASRFGVRKNGDINSSGSLSLGNNQGIFLQGSASSVNLVSGTNINWNNELYLTRRGAANLRLGAADAAAPVAQTLSVQGVVAGTTNTAGANLTIAGSQGTGTGAGGSIVFQVAPAGSSGTAQNALATALTIASNQTATFANNVTASNFIASPGATASVRARGDSGLFTLGGADDVILTRDAANTLALRNGTNGQAFNVYRTFTDASNYERGIVSWTVNSSSFTIGTQNAGTGVTRALQFMVGGTNIAGFSTSGHMVWNTDNTYDIGASGATRPRNVYVGTSVFTGTGGINFDVNSRLRSPADGQITLSNSALNDFGRLNFGGTTSSFPALKRSTTSLQARLADDSAFTNIQGKLTTETAYTAGAPTATGYLVLYDSNGTAYKIPAEAL